MTRETRAKWAERIARWEASGRAAEAYARGLGVHERTLRWWKWQLARDARRLPKREPAPVTFVEMTAAVRAEAIEIVLVTGTRIRLAVDFDSEALTRVLDVLERRR